MEQVKVNLNIVRNGLKEACHKAGRSSDEVRLMAVSKNHPLEAAMAAYEEGQRLFGENRVQEALDKFTNPPGDLELHMIGHLQSKKASKVPGLFSAIQSLDKIKTATLLDKKATDLGLQLNVLIEMNTSGEASKNGLEGEDNLWKLVEHVNGLSSLHLKGLMTLAPFVGEEVPIRRSFAALYDMYQKGIAKGYDWDTLSMGMSGDYQWAIQEGSTLVRVGTAIFGHRVYA
ncbi:YggS family pyridoxal phosphate-dependent enzyme [Spirochaeta cellobiosiphila]|uniref:YggS family pyridoxal phosphate-dependent enzyme n=1 Tax=Spirochaeta cellobiosiphila TaxID=504483 RepID=UPI0004103FC1|nr:YggS family pyridoxal phosphate-dependent enzyme [Spirochaeta cellobiosiphila]